MSKIKMRGGLGIVAITATAALVFTGCASGGDGDGSGGDEEPMTVGVTAYNMGEADAALWTAALQEAADEYGFEVVMTDGRADTTVELANIEDLITRQVDAILMQPIDGTASQPAARLVNEAGIPLFTFSTEFIDGDDIQIESYIGVDDTEAGAMQAEYLNEALPDGGDILFVAGQYGTSWTDRRKTGFESAINDNIKIVSELQAGCSRDQAQKVMEDMLQAHPAGTIDGALTQCDELAAGAANAVAAAGREDDFEAFVSVDGTESGLNALADGILTADVSLNFPLQGQLAADVLNAYFEGDDVEPVNHVELTVVTEENLSEFLD